MQSQRIFAYLIAAQALHSFEEYRLRLWESFPPARFVGGLISSNVEVGFVVINVSVVVLGILCYLGPVRRKWEGARFVAWVWVGLEVVNGVGHPAWSVAQGQYTPGLITSLLLLPLAVWLGRVLVVERRAAS